MDWLNKIMNISDMMTNFLFYLYFQLDALFCSVYIQYLGFLFPLYVSGLTGPSSGGLNCVCSEWYSPPHRCLFRVAVEILSQRPHDKDTCEGESTTGYMYNLDLMMGLWGLKHVEERENPDTVYRRKRIVYKVGNKDKINSTEMHGQQNIKMITKL